MRRERYLIAVFFVVLAAALLYRVNRLPEYSVDALPQTEVQTTPTSSVSRYAVNINDATFEELMGVKGMNERMANSILERRAEYGRFYSVDELMDYSSLSSDIRMLVDARKRRPMWKI